MAQFSFEGWSFFTWLEHNKQWFIDNKGTIKIFAAALIGYASPTNLALQTLIAAGSKLALDTLDYWVSK